MSPADGVFLLSFLFGVQKNPSMTRIHVKDGYGSAVPPWFRRNSLLSTEYQHIPGNWRMPYVAKYSATAFPCASAAHLTVCVLPAFTVPARCKCTITSLLPLLRFYGRYIIMSFIISSLYLYVNTLFSHQSKKVCSQTLYFSFVSFLLQESIQCVKNT